MAEKDRAEDGKSYKKIIPDKKSAREAVLRGRFAVMN